MPVGQDGHLYPSEDTRQLHSIPVHEDMRQLHSIPVLPIPSGGMYSNAGTSSGRTSPSPWGVGISPRDQTRPLYSSGGATQGQSTIPRGHAGIGIRVETNESGEFVIDHVHRNGAAERNGNVKHGDVIDTIDGRPVNGLKLSELGPLIRGPVGSTVTLGLRRPVPFTEKKQELHVDLVRGSSLFFLTQENQRASSKLGAMNTQLGEVELELNGLKNVLFQAESQVMRNKTDLSNMQHRYDTVQMQIEKSQQEIASEEHKLLLARLSVPTADSASRERMRTLHDSLSSAEVSLSRVMEELKEEQIHAWQLENEIAKEHSLTSHLSAKIGLEMKELENFPDYANRGMGASEVEKRKHNRELEVELDELKMGDSFVAPDHLVPQKLAEEAANELMRMRQSLEDTSRDLQEKQNEHHLTMVKSSTLQGAIERERAVLKDQEHTTARLQQQTEQDSERARDGLAQLRRFREQRARDHSGILSDLENRVQALKMERIAAENEMQLIQVDGAGQLHDAKLSAQELAALLPRKIRDNEELREQMTLKEQELDRNRAAVSEAEETRDQFLEQAALETIQCQEVCRNTENIDGEIIKSIQRQHAIDCMLSGKQKEFEEADFELTQELLDARNELVREFQELLAEREEIVNNHRGIEQLRELRDNLNARTKDFEKMRARNLERLHENLALHGDLAAKIEAVGTTHTWEDSFFTSNHQSTLEIEDSIQALERCKADYETRHKPMPMSMPPISSRTQELINQEVPAPPAPPAPPVPPEVPVPVPAEPGYVGLVVTKTRPHSILRIDDLVDPNMVKQGEPGYSNHIAMVGDLILKIDGQDAQTALLADLLDMLKGPLHTIVTLTMACKSSGRVYTVRCLRHRHHEYSLPASVPDEEDQEKADRARALETLRREKEEQERADRQRALEIVAANMKEQEKRMMLEEKEREKREQEKRIMLQEQEREKRERERSDVEKMVREDLERMRKKMEEEQQQKNMMEAAQDRQEDNISSQEAQNGTQHASPPKDGTQNREQTKPQVEELDSMTSDDNAEDVDQADSTPGTWAAANSQVNSPMAPPAKSPVGKARGDQN